MLNSILLNVIQHSVSSAHMLNAVMLVVPICYCNAGCRCAECSFARCLGVKSKDRDYFVNIIVEFVRAEQPVSKRLNLLSFSVGGYALINSVWMLVLFVYECMLKEELFSLQDVALSEAEGRYSHNF